MQLFHRVSRPLLQARWKLCRLLLPSLFWRNNSQPRFPLRQDSHPSQPRPAIVKGKLKATARTPPFSAKFPQRNSTFRRFCQNSLSERKRREVFAEIRPAKHHAAAFWSKFGQRGKTARRFGRNSVSGAKRRRVFAKIYSANKKGPKRLAVTIICHIIWHRSLRLR